MGHRHRPQGTDDEILHDFDKRQRMLRILFVDRKGGLTPVVYRLCPVCGVSMEPSDTGNQGIWDCGICGTQVKDSEEP